MPESMLAKIMLVILALVFLVPNIFALRSGKVLKRGSFKTASRKKEPIDFWSMIALRTFLGAACIFAAVLPGH